MFGRVVFAKPSVRAFFVRHSAQCTSSAHNDMLANFAIFSQHFTYTYISRTAPWPPARSIRPIRSHMNFFQTLGWRRVLVSTLKSRIQLTNFLSFTLTLLRPSVRLHYDLFPPLTLAPLHRGAVRTSALALSKEGWFLLCVLPALRQRTKHILLFLTPVLRRSKIRLFTTTVVLITPVKGVRLMQKVWSHFRLLFSTEI